MQKVSSFISGARLGALIGAAAALLLTPSSGDELREQIQERAQYVQDEVRTAASQRRTELERQLANLRAPRKSL